MKTNERNSNFTKAGEHLYRYKPNKKYYAVFRINGKLHWKSLKTTDRELAVRRLKEEHEKACKIDPRNADMSLDGLLALYDQSLAKYDEGTQENRRVIIKKFKATWPHGMNMLVRDVTTAQLDVWLSQQRARMKKTSYNSYVLVMRQMFNLAVENRAIADSPAKRFKILKPERPIRITPNWEQFQSILREVRSQKFNAEAEESGDMIELMGTAGIGLAECQGLQGEHFDFEGKKIWFYRKKTDKRYFVPVFPQLNSLLNDLKAAGKIQIGKPVFGIKNPKKALSAACRRLKLPHFSTRALRRCFITRAVEVGVDFKTISEWQGHVDGGVLIAQTYSDLRSEHSDAMAAKLTISLATEQKAA